MSGRGVWQRAEEWLSSTWQVRVPQAWLEACVGWVVQEAGGPPVSQAEVNQQVLEQWLLTDLRDLQHPVLPSHLGQAPKAELSGRYCVQVDSLLDVSRPAYAQLQQVKGTAGGNDQVSAVTQPTQRPWEAAPARMLMLKITDGVQDLEALEYRAIPALRPDLPPGTKLLLQGVIACRLGVLLLEQGNIRVLGGEVEELKEANSQGKVLCRVLGLHEDEPQGEGAQEGGGGAQEQGAEPHQGDEGFSDEELLASLEAAATVESGYGSRSEVSDWSYRGSATERAPSSLLTPSPAPSHDPVASHDMDEDFDDIPLDELDSVIFQEPDPPVEAEPVLVEEEPMVVEEGPVLEEVGSRAGPHLQNMFIGLENRDQVALRASPVGPQGRSAAFSGAGRPRLGEESHQSPTEPSSRHTNSDHGPGWPDEVRGTKTLGADVVDLTTDSTASVDSSTSPFTYLCTLPKGGTGESVQVQVKAFILTLLSKLQSSSGAWQVSATISDGSGFLDVRLSDGVLAGLIGLTATESRVLRRSPEGQREVQEAMQRCQRELVDTCHLMTLQYDPTSVTGVVLRADEVTTDTCQELKNHVRHRRAQN